jgi:hypothetical protein
VLHVKDWGHIAYSVVEHDLARFGDRMAADKGVRLRRPTWSLERLDG